MTSFAENAPRCARDRGAVGLLPGWERCLVAMAISATEVNGRLRALQRAGLPTSGAELNQWYAAVPDRRTQRW